MLQTSYIYSQSVLYNEAEDVARNFFGKKHKSLQSCADISVKDTDTLFYVFNSDNGFVVVSADKRTIPILAYSTEDIYNVSDIIPPVKMWLDYYQTQLQAIVNNKTLTQTEHVNNSWKELQKPVKTHKAMEVVIPPLLTSKWGQGKEYNYYCPKDENAYYNKRAVTGCVATAMAQLMYYFRFPQKGSGDYSYQHDKYGEISADFENTIYDYSSMTDKPKEINSAISLLTYHCGVAVDMLYGANSSGMYNHKAAYALKTHFNFSDSTKYVFRDSTDLDWDSLIISHLDNKIPLYYAGWSVPDTIGHAFICDGYQVDSSNNNYYHFNFGWDGIYGNSYFHINALSPGGNNFNLAQELIINAYPDTTKFTYPPLTLLTGDTVFKTETGSFAVGMLYDCPQNMDYKWIVRPDVDEIEKMSFNLSYKLAPEDTIFVISLNGTFNRMFTNDTSTFSTEEIKDTEFYLRLKTTNQFAFSGGFVGSYTTTSKNYCHTSIDLYKTNSGTVDDGSANNRYNNFSNCVYGIAVSGSSITVKFSKFDTEAYKDILYFRNNSSTGNILAELSGILEDSVYTFPTNRLYIEFKTDEKNTRDGWTFFYDTDVTNISNIEKDNRVNIYPNPSNGDIFIELTEIFSNTKIQIFDIYGKLLKEQIFTNNTLHVQLNDLACGIYFVKIIDDKNGVVTRKIIINR